MTDKDRSKPFVPALGFHGFTKLYDAVVRTTMPEKAFKMALMVQAGIQPGFKVLDFGCGTGTLTKLTAEAHQEASIIGVDVDANILGIAKNKVGKTASNVQLELYDGNKLPYDDASFDRVISSLVFHHLSKDQKQNAFSEIYRVLRPQGELHIADWGQASNLLMRLLYYPVQILDGFETTTDNVNGLLPSYISKGGFNNVTVNGSFSTVFGTLSLFLAKKSRNT